MKATLQTVALLLYCLQFAATQSQILESGISAEEQQQILDVHNNLRSSVDPPAANMQELQWNSELARIAQTYTNSCDFTNNPNLATQSSSFVTVGENIIAASSEQINYETLVQFWFDQGLNYNYSVGECNFGSVCTHYTQLVWARTTMVGCGATRCSMLNQFAIPNSVVFVCNYAPGGNIEGERPYRSGIPCSECPPDAAMCLNNTFCAPSALVTSNTTPTPSALVTSNTNTTPTPSPLVTRVISSDTPQTSTLPQPTVEVSTHTAQSSVQPQTSTLPQPTIEGSTNAAQPSVQPTQTSSTPSFVQPTLITHTSTLVTQLPLPSPSSRSKTDAIPYVTSPTAASTMPDSEGEDCTGHMCPKTGGRGGKKGSRPRHRHRPKSMPKRSKCKGRRSKSKGRRSKHTKSHRRSKSPRRG